ncbi:MAG: Flp pilus assembly complex ATPase component TadA [Oscillospiraceae bacterium]|nr:Flp pilus assembly complex ATPase component TadA [Oscillospiraceae bacterium]
MDKNIQLILNKLPHKVQEFFIKNSDSNITEIRLRKGFDIRITVNGEYHKISDTYISDEVLSELYYEFCNHTVSAYEEQTGKGFITLPGGHRIGLGGKYITDEKGKTLLTEVTSMNIRLSHFHFFEINTEIINFNKGLLIAGRPHSGKTTFLKNICYMLQHTNLVVCDERNELYVSDICCDYIINIPKQQAVYQAIRTLNPDYIICDELSPDDAKQLISGVNSGVKFVCTIHCSDIQELMNKPDISLLLSVCAFDKIIVLDNIKSNFYIKEIIDV